jgi:SAM-dependent methyltransferase
MSIATEFGLNHHAYRRFRPHYPAQLYARVLDSLARPRDLAVDLGAGTGLVSLVLGQSFRRVVAVEPDPGMAAHLKETAPMAELQAVVAEQAQFEPGSVDLVTCANAFHWMAGKEVAAAIANWLGDGALFAGWRYPMPTMPPIIADLVRDELTRWAGFLDRRSLDMKSMQTSFGALPEFKLLADEILPNPVPMNVDALIGFLRSVSFVAAFLRSLEPDDAEAYLEQIAERLRGRIGDGEFELDFPLTLVLACRRPR